VGENKGEDIAETTNSPSNLDPSLIFYEKNSLIKSQTFIKPKAYTLK
jgi:hypothetical protein